MVEPVKHWQHIAPPAEPAHALANVLGIPFAVAQMLVARGFEDPAAADLFLNPRLSAIGNPFELPDLRAAAERIWQAIDAGRRIAVFGDYDVDGLTSTALLVSFLRQCGADVVPFLPHRLEEGYGLSPEALARCMDDCQPALIVTVDCGTGSTDAVQAAHARGVDVIVTDHHQPGEHRAPARALVNPKLGSNEAMHGLAGVGVAFKLCHGMVKLGREQGRRAMAALDLKPYLDFVALGTVADIVPLTGENRIFARHGLAVMNQNPHVGLGALAHVAGIQSKIDAYEVGFLMGPRLNAAGRLGDAQRSLDLLLCEDPARASELALELDRANRERQDIETRTLNEALKELEARFDPRHDFGLVVGHEGWHPGVVGIVAARLVQRFYRPAVVVALSEEGGRGSCRSIDGFDLVSGLASCSEYLAKFGGHAMAAGLEIKPDCLASFAAHFNRVAERKLSGRDLRPIQRIDAWVDLETVDESLVAAMERMRPFGMGNPTPVLAARGVRVVGPPRVVGQEHWKLVVASGTRQMEAIGWRMARRAIPKEPLDIAFHVRRDRFRGEERLVLHLQDFRPAE